MLILKLCASILAIAFKIGTLFIWTAPYLPGLVYISFLIFASWMPLSNSFNIKWVLFDQKILQFIDIRSKKNIKSYKTILLYSFYCIVTGHDLTKTHFVFAMELLSVE